MSAIATLPPAHRFMYEYGCFTAFWSNFKLLMEVAICDLSGRMAKDNCRIVNTQTAGKKRATLERLLLQAGRLEAVALLQNVFDIAERNSWIHGHILNPRGDFSKLTRLRIEQNGGALTVTNKEISFALSPFQGFYSAYKAFQDKLGTTPERCNAYITELKK